MHIFKRIVIPDLGGQDQRDERQSFPIAVVHQQAALSQESLDINQAQNRNFLFHSALDDNVFAVVIQLLKTGVASILSHAAYKLVLIKIVILIVDSELKSH